MNRYEIGLKTFFNHLCCFCNHLFSNRFTPKNWAKTFSSFLETTPFPNSHQIFLNNIKFAPESKLHEIFIKNNTHRIASQKHQLRLASLAFLLCGLLSCIFATIFASGGDSSVDWASNWWSKVADPRFDSLTGNASLSLKKTLNSCFPVGPSVCNWTVDSSSIPGRVKPKTIKNRIHRFPAWRSAIKGTEWSLRSVW